jgi:DNA-binding beta-propeller fold protein YncE
MVGGLAVDNARGYLYIANRENRDVDRWNLSDGSFNHRFPMPAGRLYANGWPRAVAVNETTGRFYAADEKDNQFVIFSSTSTKPVAIVRRYGPGVGHRLGSLHSLAWDPSTHLLYVADFTHSMIDVYNGKGDWIRSFPVASTPNGVAVAHGIVYVMSFHLLEYTTTGTLIGSFGTMGSGDSQFLHPYGGIAIDASRQVLIADSGNHRVKVFTPERILESSGAVQTSAPRRALSPSRNRRATVLQTSARWAVRPGPTRSPRRSSTTAPRLPHRRS